MMDERFRSGMMPSADRVPTLTEVLELDPSPALQAPAALEWAPEPEPETAAASDGPPEPVPDEPLAAWPVPIDEDTLIARVVDALLPTLDALLEARLLEALAPALERAAEQILLESRAQLAVTLHQCVQETVAQVLQSTRVDP